MIGETLTVTRGETDKRGNRNVTDTHTISGVIGYGSYTRNNEPYAESATGTVELYTDKGVDVLPRDRITRANGQSFTVVAGPMWDHLHPFTGRDYGWTVFTLDTVTG